ncbi:MAG: ABC transporter permease, partial [Paenibacillus macerans]|nr:ABC transporter permease [Paenibacillus macerans]
MTLLKKKWAGLLFLWLFILAAWQGGAWLYGPEVVPGPADTAAGALELLRDGSLPKYIGISFYRVFSGWMLGSLISIPLGILIGKV